MSLAHVFAAPLRFGKYGRATFFEVNVICLVVMYTDKVLRPCHMLMLDNTFWAERLTVVVVVGWAGILWKDGEGRGGGGGGRQMVSRSHSSPGFVLMAAGSSLVILGSTPKPPHKPPTQF